MAHLGCNPVPHDHVLFLSKARQRKGFDAAYLALDEDYARIREQLARRADVDVRPGARRDASGDPGLT